MGRPNRAFPFKVAAFSQASVFQNSQKPLNPKNKVSNENQRDAMQSTFEFTNSLTLL